MSLKCAYVCWLNLHPTHSTPLAKFFWVLIWIGLQSNPCLTYQFSHHSCFSLNLGEDCLKYLSPLSTFLDNYAISEISFAKNQSSIPTADNLAIKLQVIATFWTIAITIHVGFCVWIFHWTCRIEFTMKDWSKTDRTDINQKPFDCIWIVDSSEVQHGS